MRVHFFFLKEGYQWMPLIDQRLGLPSSLKWKKSDQSLAIFLELKVYLEQFVANRGARLIALSVVEDNWFQSYVALGQFQWLLNLFVIEALRLWSVLSMITWLEDHMVGLVTRVIKCIFWILVLGYINEIFRWKQIFFWGRNLAIFDFRNIIYY